MNETWVTLADDDVLSAESAERKTVVSIKKKDDLGDICSQVTEQVRQAYSLANRELGAEGTIPAGLKARAISIALWRFVTEGVGKYPVSQTKQRQDAHDEAVKFLQTIAENQVGRASSPSMGKRVRTFGRWAEDGL
jgi:hypothetical protein